MKETGIKNRNKIAGAINVLEYLRLVRVEKYKHGQSNLYYLLHHSFWRELTSISRDTTRKVSKMGRKEYQKQLSTSITGDTRNQLKNSTKEIRSNRRSGTEAMKHIGESLRWYKNTNP